MSDDRHITIETSDLLAILTAILLTNQLYTPEGTIKIAAKKALDILTEARVSCGWAVLERTDDETTTKT